MWTSLYFSLLFVLSFINAVKPIPRIRGGNELTERTGFAYQISLQYKGQHRCGGAIISKQHVLTSASCCRDPTQDGMVMVNPEDLTVVAGSLQLYSDPKAVERKVKEITLFEESGVDITMYKHNIAILRISKPFDLWSDDISWIKLAHNTLPASACKVSGWGATQKDGQVNSQLKAADVPLISNWDCSICVGSYSNNRLICAGNQTNGFFQGDEGGPLVCYGLLTGIALYNLDCWVIAVKDVYTQLAKYADWIEAEIEKSPNSSHLKSIELLLPVVVLILAKLFR